MTRPLISLGDALRAAHDLRPADAQAQGALRRMLGLEDEDLFTPATPSMGAALPSASEQIKTLPSEPPHPLRWRRTAGEADDVRAAAAAAGPRVAYRLTKVAAGRGPAEVPAWLATGETLATDATAEPPPALPLFSRVKRRGILSAALATYVNEGEIDLDAAIESLAALCPITRLPRSAVPTLRRGVQLLLDRGAGMDPFLADQDTLLRQLDDILSDERLEVLYFEGCPGRGVADRPRGSRRPWQQPASGTPVLLVTDFGIGGPLLDEDGASVREWLRFSQKARSVGHTPLGLVPYEARRWPPLLARAMVLLHWSERTTAGEVRRATRDGLVRSG